ncbi:hypothetical protein BsWGS_02678 [Bradybaena similaris]
MATAKITFVTGTAEVKRRDPVQEFARSEPLPEQRLTTEPHTPLQVTYIDGKCTCCPYGYHIDLDFLNFCRDLERGSTLKNLKRIQRTKRKLRKSMEMMLDEQEGTAPSSKSTPPDVVHSTEAGRLMHMINYEQSATQNLLSRIDASVSSAANLEGGPGKRYISSDSDEPRTPFSPTYRSIYPLDESNIMTTSYSTLDRTDSFGSLSSVSTLSSENALTHPAEKQLYYKTKTEVLENPVLEMGTAEIKHYSTTSSAQLANNKVIQPSIRPATDGKPLGAVKSPSALGAVKSPLPDTLVKTPPATISKDDNPASLQSVREAMAVSLQRMRELEEQVKTIPILQVRISVLKEEKRLLSLQLKASNASAKPPVSSIGVGDDRVDVVEIMEHSVKSPRAVDFPKSFYENDKLPAQKSPAQKSPQVKSPPLTLPKPARTFSVGVGDHSVTEPYNLQPDLPSGYTIRDNETTFEIHSRTTIQQTTAPLNRITLHSLNRSFQHSPEHETMNRELKTPITQHPVLDSSSPHFTINQIQRSSPRALTRTVGTGDGNVFEDSGLHVHEKELRTVIIGQSSPVAKRNVGIECRVPTRDVGVLFICDEAKPETRTVGVNVNYDTSGIHTTLDFKGETELRMALRGVLQRNVRSVGTNCNFKATAVDTSTATDLFTGVNVGCGDEEHRVDVDIRPATAKKSVATAAKPETGHKWVGTEPGWVLDASTNTYQVDTYHKSVMTDKQKQTFACTNTEPAIRHIAACQTEQKIFWSLDQVRNAASNTEPAKTYSTGMSTDIVPSVTVGINTTEQVSDVFQTSTEQKTSVQTKELKSILKKPKTGDSPVGGERRIDHGNKDHLETSIKVQAASHEGTFFNRYGDVKKSSSSDGGQHFTSRVAREQTAITSPPQIQDFVSGRGAFFNSREELLNKSSSQEDLENRHSAFKRVSPNKSEDGFSETVVEHYVITNNGKKLISEEKTMTSSSGTNKSFKKYADDDKDFWSQTFEADVDSCSGADGDSRLTGSDMSSIGSHENCAVDKANENTMTEKNFVSVINNPYLTVDNLAEVSSLLDSNIGDTLILPHISKTASDISLYRDNREMKPAQIEKASSGEMIYDMRKTGSVEDFMPDDIRRYMCIDPSPSKDSGFGEDLIRRFSEESSGQIPHPSLSPEVDTSDDSRTRNVKTTKTITTKHITRAGDKVSVRETKTVTGPDSEATTFVTETTEDGSSLWEDKSHVGQHPISLTSQDDSETKTASSASMTNFSNMLSSQHWSDSNLLSSVSGDSQFAGRGNLNVSGTKSYSETTMTAVGGSDGDLAGDVGNYGSLDRKTGKLKSIMKRRPSDSQQIGSRKITFAESVTGGTGSSSQEEDENTSDSDSTASFEEGSYDGQQGEVIYYCKDDEAIAQGLPGAQMFDQNIREIYELPSDVRQACNVLATYLVDSTSIQTKQLNACQSQVQEEWFKVSSHKLSVAHQVEDFLSSINEISKKLLEHVINMTDANGNTAIHYCVSHGNFDIVSLLLDSEVCDINKQNKAGYTPIMLAGLLTLQNPEHLETVRRLFSLGDVNARATSTKQTALMLAASHGRTEMVRLLVEEGADVNLQDEDGSTALMCACEHGNLDIVNFLLAQPGIDANIADNEDSTALSIAMQAGHKDVGVVLYKHLNFSKVTSPAGHKRRRSSNSPTPSNFAIR